MWELDYKESWVPKNWCFWNVVLEKTLESPLDRKEIQPDDLKRDQSRVFIGRTDVEVETPILWPPDAKSWLIGKDPDAGKDWGQEEKGTTEDEMVRWHHRLNGHGFGWTLAVGHEQGGPGCCVSRGRKESDTAELLNWTYRKKEIDANIRVTDSPYILWWNNNISVFKKRNIFMIQLIYTMWILHSASKIIQLYFIMKIAIHLHNFPSCPTYDKRMGFRKNWKYRESMANDFITCLHAVTEG